MNVGEVDSANHPPDIGHFVVNKPKGIFVIIGVAYLLDVLGGWCLEHRHKLIAHIGVNNPNPVWPNSCRFQNLLVKPWRKYCAIVSRKQVYVSRSLFESPIILLPSAVLPGLGRY